jgi:hypothetical protein
MWITMCLNTQNLLKITLDKVIEIGVAPLPDESGFPLRSNKRGIAESKSRKFGIRG